MEQHVAGKHTAQAAPAIDPSSQSKPVKQPPLNNEPVKKPASSVPKPEPTKAVKDKVGEAVSSSDSAASQRSEAAKKVQ